MQLFESLFGLPAKQIHKTCILAPFLYKGMLEEFGINKFHKGKPYGSGSHEHFTLIYTGIGSTLLGDAVVYLKNSPCQNFILFGACGLIHPADDFTIGTIVLPIQCYAFESFSDNLYKNFSKSNLSYPSRRLLKKFTAFHHHPAIKKVTAATLGSISLEKENTPFLKRKNVDVVDLECSSFLNAAQHIKRKAFSLLYITDIISQKSVYAPLSPTEAQLIHSARQTAAQILKKFCKKIS